jgi:hypothetical protein
LFSKLLIASALFAVNPVIGAPLVAESVQQVLEVKEEKLTEEKLTEEKPTVVKEDRWVLPHGTKNERYVLQALQDRGITDQYALATVLGNIKQESRFVPNICEGGARISYGSCNYGGYGLIQWTSYNRYRGLGTYSFNRGMNPSTIEAQTAYMFAEYQWQKFEPKLKNPGQSIGYYMNGAHRWLGWGIHGNRTYYANSYLNRLQLKEVTVDV